jgi:S1-C subfamily serine protease
MNARRCFLLCLLLTGCNDNLETVPESPPPAERPALPADASLRPLYLLDKGPAVAAGTAFVVQDKAGKLLMLTAAHVRDNEAEWNEVRSGALRIMGGAVVGQTRDRPVYVGKSFTETNAALDLVVWPLADGAKAKPLPLAGADAKKNEWVWAVGQEASSSGPQKLYRCKVTGTSNGGLQLEQHDRFEMRGFSGGPLINAQGEVIGSLLGGKDAVVIGARVSSIRARLAESKIDLP